jgi:hypothetical protein
MLSLLPELEALIQRAESLLASIDAEADNKAAPYSARDAADVAWGSLNGEYQELLRAREAIQKFHASRASTA